MCGSEGARESYTHLGGTRLVVSHACRHGLTLRQGWLHKMMEVSNRDEWRRSTKTERVANVVGHHRTHVHICCTSLLARTILRGTSKVNDFEMTLDLYSSTSHQKQLGGINICLLENIVLKRSSRRRVNAQCQSQGGASCTNSPLEHKFRGQDLAPCYFGCEHPQKPLDTCLSSTLDTACLL